MRLEAVSGSTFKRAVGTFLEHAWGDLRESHWPKIDFDHDRSELLAAFTDECQQGCMRKYSLRLGNRRYPFMKLLFQESLVRDSFFFAVDTHDELDIKETTPDYAEWLAIKEYNARIKKAVESDWRADAVPTFHDILEDVDGAAVPENQICPLEDPPVIFVVDDDKDIAEGARRILTRRGYEVTVSHSAEEALDKMKTSKPDLILSDLEMGQGMTGLDFVARIRKSARLRSTPFVLATAAGIDLTHFDNLDGFIVKPYEISVLMAFMSRHLEPA